MPPSASKQTNIRPRYFYDARSELCFATNNNGSNYGSTATYGFTYVPCSVAVFKLANVPDGTPIRR